MEINETKKELIELVDTIRSATGLSQKEISKKAGYTSENTIAQAISRKDGHEPVIRRLKSLFPDEAASIANTAQKEVKKRRDIHRQETEKAPQSEKESDLSIQTLYKLANANEMLAHSNKELAIMLKQERKAANFPEEIVEAFGSTIQNLQDVVMDVALGKKFQDRQEIAAALTGKADISVLG